MLSKRMNNIHKFPEFHLLSEFLSAEMVPDYYPITFQEESEADNRFALRVHDHVGGRVRPDLLRKLAAFFGCPEAELPEEGDCSFEASDTWHCRGKGNLRDLADEIIKNDGQFFDLCYAVGEIRHIGNQIKPVTDFLHVAMVSEGQCRQSSETFTGASHVELVSKVAAFCRSGWSAAVMDGDPPMDDAAAVDAFFADSYLVLVWGALER